VVTGSRAEYGLLFWLLNNLKADTECQLQLIVTGMHLSPEFGLTWRQIELDGFRIDKKVEMLLSSDTPVGISKAIGLGVIGFADALNELQPDILVVLGDRFEIFAAVQAALYARIPVGHIHGGELTQGAVDDAIRHSMTKMAHLHFTSTDRYRQRVIQLGEPPERVFNTGALGVDSIQKLHLLSREALTEKQGVTFAKHNILVTFHPVTLEEATVEAQFSALLQALDEREETHLFFTKPNADAGGRIIIQMIDEYVEVNRHKAVSFVSMGSLFYLSMLQFVDCVVGNSSSGLIEAPSFKIATLNIGERQQGRIKADSVIDCEATLSGIREGFSRLFSEDFQVLLQDVVNPHGEGEAAEKMTQILKTYPLTNIIKKHFFDLDRL